MEIASSYIRPTAFGQLVLIPDPIDVTPPLALNPFHLVHPGGYSGRWQHVRIGPVTCSQPNPQTFTFAVWGWGIGGWVLLLDHIKLVAKNIGAGVDQGDCLVLSVPEVESEGPITALCVLPRACAVATDLYTINIAGIDARRWPC